MTDIKTVANSRRPLKIGSKRPSGVDGFGDDSRQQPPYSSPRSFHHGLFAPANPPSGGNRRRRLIIHIRLLAYEGAATWPNLSSRGPTYGIQSARRKCCLWQVTAINAWANHSVQTLVVRYSWIDRAAVRPAPMARMTVPAPLTMSPPAKTPRFVVRSVFSSAMM